MDFTIVTPSFGQLDQLECCIASVADQEGISVEHIVQDGGTAGFAEFAKKMTQRWPDRPGYRRIMINEKDNGMYDAINRGLAKAKGSICAYLNCDEQYLPETLRKIWDRFQHHPDVDLFFGDALVLDEKGEARCWRKVLVPLVNHTWTCHFAAFTASMFFRRKLVVEGLCFDITYRAAADAAWYLQTRRRKIRVQSLGFITSAFVETGKNLGMTPTARQERDRLSRTAPAWIQALRPFWMLWHRARRLLRGAYGAKSLHYEVFRAGSLARQAFLANSLRATWPGRMWGY